MLISIKRHLEYGPPHHCRQSIVVLSTTILCPFHVSSLWFLSLSHSIIVTKVVCKNCIRYYKFKGINQYKEKIEGLSIKKKETISTKFNSEQFILFFWLTYLTVSPRNMSNWSWESILFKCSWPTCIKKNF